MHFSPQIKILDLDHVESILEQEITLAEAEKIVGGRKFSNVSISISSHTLEKILISSPRPPSKMDPIDIPPILKPSFTSSIIHTPSGPAIITDA